MSEYYLARRNVFCRWVPDIHQSSGVLPVNSHFQGFAKAMGLRPGHSKAVLPDVGNQTFMTAFFEMLDAQVGGRNYWWPDNACALCFTPAVTFRLI